MNQIFFRILNMSIVGGLLVAVVVFLRLILRRVPKWIICILWAIVALRLILPFNIESPVSAVPYDLAAGALIQDIAGYEVGSEAGVLAGNENSDSNQFFAISTSKANPDADNNPGNIITDAAAKTPAGQCTSLLSWLKTHLWLIWICGISVMLIYALVSFIKLRISLAASIRVENGEGKTRVFASDHISSPFLLGIFRPSIYVPSSIIIPYRSKSSMATNSANVPEGLNPQVSAAKVSSVCAAIDEAATASGEAPRTEIALKSSPEIVPEGDLGQSDLHFILQHEKAHVSRGDHLWKPLGFILLSINWFNPLIWLGYILLCRDIEAACDEKVIRGMDKEARAEYSRTILNFSSPGRRISACPVAFGETGAKSRIKAVLNYKKPAFWIIIAAIVLCIAVGIFFLTARPCNEPDPDNTAIDSSIPYTKDSSDGDYSAWLIDQVQEQMIEPQLPQLINDYLTDNIQQDSASAAEATEKESAWQEAGEPEKALADSETNPNNFNIVSSADILTAPAFQLTGTISATLRKLVPDYNLDDYSVRMAIITQDDYDLPIAVSLSQLIEKGDFDPASLEIGETYIFTIESSVIGGPVGDPKNLYNPLWANSGKINVTDIRPASGNKEVFTVLSEVPAEYRTAASDTGNNEPARTRVSGPATYILRDLLPTYGINDQTGFALVQQFHGPVFVIQVMNADTSSLEIGRYYDFTFEEKVFDTPPSFLKHYLGERISSMMSVTDITPGDAHSGLEGLQLTFEGID